MLTPEQAKDHSLAVAKALLLDCPSGFDTADALCVLGLTTSAVLSSVSPEEAGTWIACLLQSLAIAAEQQPSIRAANVVDLHSYRGTKH